MLFGCSNNQNECIDNQINPNGDSELAIVMRNLFDNSLEIKSHIIELDDFKNARIELAKAIALGKEDEAESWISYMDSTDSLRAAAAAN